jgi:hypothetical protein
MPDRSGLGPSTITRSLLILISLLLTDYVLFRLLPGVDTGANRTLRYAPILGLSVVLFLLGLALTLRSDRAASVSASTMPADWRASPALSKVFASILVVGVASSVFFAYLVGKALVFRLDHESFWKDTVTYAAVAEAPLSSSDFWAGQRSFTVPLIYKFLDANQATVHRLSRMRRISGFQLILGILCWTSLAAATAGLVKSRMLKPVGFAVVLALGLTLDVSMWDRVLLTESTSTSLLVLIVALALVGLKNRNYLGRHGAWWQIPFWMLVCVLCVLYSFTRDTNAYFLAACGLAILAGMMVPRIRRHPSAIACGAFSIFLLSLFLVQSMTANKGDRWVLPYFNILHTRVFPDADAREFFQAAGMPADSATAGILRLDQYPFLQALKYNFGAQPLIDWVNTDGKATYARYLLSRPVETLVQPFRRARNLVSPVSTEYRADDYSVPVWLHLLSRVFFPLPLTIVLVWSGIVVLAAYLTGRRRGTRSEWIVPALLLLTALPMMYVVWYGDAVEVERHAFQISLQIRLGLWLMTVLLADAWLAGRRRPSAVDAAA